MSTQVEYLVGLIDDRRKQVEATNGMITSMVGSESIIASWYLLSLEVFRQIVVDEALTHAEDITDSDNLVRIAIAMGLHDPTLPPEEHDDEIPGMEYLRRKA